MYCSPRSLLIAVVLLVCASPAFAQPISLPAVGVWNGFNAHVNVVECLNLSGETGNIKLTVVRSNGVELGARELEIPANGTRHIVLNQFEIIDRHGIFRIEQTDVETEEEDIPTLRLHCYTSLYRMAAEGSAKPVEYALTLPITEPFTESTSGIFNSLNPDGSGRPILNWLSVYNPGEVPIEGVVQLYDQEGNFLDAFNIEQQQPGERDDFPLGHPDGEVVGMYRISLFENPDDDSEDGEPQYGAFLTRYSTVEQTPGSPLRYNFAFPLQASPGTCDSGPVSASTMDPAVNWAEIANPSPVDDVQVRFEVRDSVGAMLHQEVRTISRFSQEHIYLNQYLGPRNVGSFRVTCTDEDVEEQAVLVQSLFYGHVSGAPNQIEWAYATQPSARLATPGDAFIAPINTFLGMSNWFKVRNTESLVTDVQENIYSEQGILDNQNFRELRSLGGVDLPIHVVTGPAFVGTVATSSITEESQFSAEMLRVFPGQSGGLGYVMPVPAALMTNALTANPQIVSASLDTSKQITLSASNEERESLYYSITEYPENGRITGSRPNITYIPDSQYVGTDEFEYRVHDGTGWSQPAKVSITIDNWEPPIGTPAPSFGLVQKSPALPDPWNQSTEGFYYVEPTHHRATNETNPYGTPGTPRATIPNVLLPGQVVVVVGNYDVEHRKGVNDFISAGTAENPIFIRGLSSDERPYITKPWHISGSYMIFENLRFGDADGDSSGGDTGLVTVFGPAHHIAVRYSDIRGNREQGGVRVSDWLGNTTNDIVIYNNDIRDIGQWWTSSQDDPVHAVHVENGASNVWIARNDIFRTAGYGVLVDAGSLADMASTHHIYVGDNSASNNRLSGYWVGHATDVVVSQNHSQRHRPTSSTPGACMGYEHGPQHLWFLYNRLEDCEVGIATRTDEEGESSGPGDNIFLIGNLIYEMDNSSDNEDGAARDGAAIRLANDGPNVFVLNNTIHDVEAGIMHPAGNGTLTIANNIFSDVDNEDLFVVSGAAAISSAVHNNLFDGSAVIKWASNTPRNVAEFQAVFAGQCAACIEGTPTFENANNEEFELIQTSTGINAASSLPLDFAEQTFQARFGRSINFDFAELNRTIGPAPDLGAYEFDPSSIEDED